MVGEQVEYVTQDLILLTYMVSTVSGIAPWEGDVLGYR